MDKTEKLFRYKQGDTLPFGVTKVADGVQFAVSIPKGGDCYLNIYKTGQKRPSCRIRLSREYRRGSVYFVKITDCPDTDDQHTVADILSRDYEYMYEVDGREFVDPYAAVIHGRERWGRRTGEGNRIRGGISLESFDWQDDSPLSIPFSDMILYQLHVRGFTRHASSKVAHRGSFDGLQEKIPYLKELGINAVLLLPCYEFDEIQIGAKVHGAPKQAAGKTTDSVAVGAGKHKENVVQEKGKINYWGYGQSETYYYAPKAAYAADPHHAGVEFKTLVRSLHQAGIEILLDIYFMPGTNVCLREDCLRNWVLEYHVDGFRVNQEVMPSQMLVSDPILSGVKLLTDYWNRELVAGAGDNGLLAEYNEGFMNCARRYLKSDEGQVEGFSGFFRRGSGQIANINFMTYVNGFTMMDLVSYDVKHNEENGEGNQDGTEYNYSWNCGIEGKSRKKYILSRRMCQIRNAFAMMLLAQGTPMLLAGDEFGNSQEGNNNPYCQDNEITWLDWRMTSMRAGILEYVKKLIAFRKEHPVLHQGRELYMFDSLSCGMPDVSIHGTQAWRADFSYYSRMLAVLLYGDYQQKAGKPDDSIYIIFNMYWEPKSFDLPNLPGEREWYPAIETYGNTFSTVPQPVRKKRSHKKPSLESQKKTIVPPRSVVVFVGR